MTRALISWVALGGLSLAQGRVIDRVVAVVNNVSITQSEWEVQSRYEALAGKKDPKHTALDPLALERLIDKAIVHERLASLQSEAATPAQIATQIADLRQELAIGSDEQWSKKLAAYGLTQEDLQWHISEQVTLWNYVERRFRSNVNVTEDDIKDYYGDTFVPQMRKRGIPEKDMPALEAVEERITRVLLEQRIGDVFQTWLKAARTQARIKRLVGTYGAENKSGT